MNLLELKQLKESGAFHHASYRNIGTLWEGLWIYKKSPLIARGFEPCGCFMKNSPELESAELLLIETGISVGCYGQG